MAWCATCMDDEDEHIMVIGTAPGVDEDVPDLRTRNYIDEAVPANEIPSQRRNFTEQKREIHQPHVSTPTHHAHPGAGVTMTASENPVSAEHAHNMKQKRSHRDFSSGMGESVDNKIAKAIDMMEMEVPEDDVAGYDCARRMCDKILKGRFRGQDTNMFDTIMGFIILFNVGIMIVETDSTATCELSDVRDCVPYWIHLTNYVLLAIYTVEILMRLFVLRLRFFCVKWNLIDFFVVSLGLLDLFAFPANSSSSTVNLLRILRISKVIRVAKILNRFPTLHNMISGFAGAMQAMVWGLVMILVLLTMWSLLAVEIVHPVNKTLPHDDPDGYCAQAFTTVVRSTLLFFQTLVAGDSWGSCILPIIKKEPATYLLFAVALLTVQLGLTNLILAVIVDKAAEARDQLKKQMDAATLEKGQAAFSRWEEQMEALDRDGTGDISFNELMDGYKHMPDVQEVLGSMSICQDDLALLFHLMDMDDSGHLSFHEITEIFRKSQGMDLRTYLMLTKLQLQKQTQQLETKLFTGMSERFDEVFRSLDEIRDAVLARNGRHHRVRNPRHLVTEVTHQAQPPLSPMSTGPVSSETLAAPLEGPAGSMVVGAKCGPAAVPPKKPPAAPASDDRDGAGADEVRQAPSSLKAVQPPIATAQGGGEEGGAFSSAFAAEVRRLRESLEARFDDLAAAVRTGREERRACGGSAESLPRPRACSGQADGRTHAAEAASEEPHPPAEARAACLGRLGPSAPPGPASSCGDLPGSRGPHGAASTRAFAAPRLGASPHRLPEEDSGAPLAATCCGPSPRPSPQEQQSGKVWCDRKAEIHM